MKLDDFDAVFRSSVKDRFKLEAPALASVLLITDMLPADAAQLETAARAFLSTGRAAEPAWRTVGEDEYKSTSELLELIGNAAPDLIVCYRHLLGRQKQLRYSLGSFVDTLTQATVTPVLLLPPPTADDFDDRIAALDSVLVVTDRLTGDDRLVNWGLRLCPDKGTLYVAHVEDERTFDRYASIISMIPDIDTDTTVERVRDKLLGRPADYMASIVEALEAAEPSGNIVPIVTMAHALSDYKRIIAEHDIDLVVLNTKDDQQLAMHGMAYALSVELQEKPLLLL